MTERRINPSIPESRTTRIMASYICKPCDIEGQDQEIAPWRVFCWNCEDEAMITARIVTEGEEGKYIPIPSSETTATEPTQEIGGEPQDANGAVVFQRHESPVVTHLDSSRPKKTERKPTRPKQPRKAS